jgi:hypothetical protein
MLVQSSFLSRLENNFAYIHPGHILVVEVGGQQLSANNRGLAHAALDEQRRYRSHAIAPRA